MSDKEQRGNTGIGFLGLLCILFIGLKLTGYITWSWWWVLSPLWIPAAVMLTVLAVALVVSVVMLIIAWFIKRE